MCASEIRVSVQKKRHTFHSKNVGVEYGHVRASLEKEEDTIQVFIPIHGLCFQSKVDNTLLANCVLVWVYFKQDEVLSLISKK